tara:strand:- start:310 stop:666 length:357 start_codon:yes stop_codon:yes gene_type:complete
MSNQLGYEGREAERRSVIKDHLTDYLEDVDLTLQDIAEQTDLIHDNYIYYEFMPYSYDIFLFFDIDMLLTVNDFLKEYGETDEILDYVLVDFYAHSIVYQCIDQWAEQEIERVAIKPL